MSIRRAKDSDKEELISLIDKFRMLLAELRNKEYKEDLEMAETELREYLRDDYPIYVAECSGQGIVGYMVCRVDDGVVWVESLYVLAEYRRKGFATSLYEKAEELADSLGGQAPYNWVDPNNHMMISFLQKRGYSVLNLIELRRPEHEETTTQKIRVGSHEFDRP